MFGIRTTTPFRRSGRVSIGGNNDFDFGNWGADTITLLQGIKACVEISPWGADLAVKFDCKFETVVESTGLETSPCWVGVAMVAGSERTTIAVLPQQPCSNPRGLWATELDL
jgi:hypothetical protein